MRQDRITRARSWLDEGIEFVRGVCTAENLRALAGETDLVVVPLALRGSKAEFYRTPPAPHVLIHDWLWRPRGGSMVVSWLLLKRLNLVFLPKDDVNSHQTLFLEKSYSSSISASVSRTRTRTRTRTIHQPPT